jgi:hypothetical protein
VKLKVPAPLNAGLKLPLLTKDPVNAPPIGLPARITGASLVVTLLYVPASTVGLAKTVTVSDAELLHPLASVTVTEYDTLSDAVIACVVAPFDQL